MQFRLNQRALTELAWRQMFDYLSLTTEERIRRFAAEISALEGFRAKAQYNTGSISAFGALSCYALAAYVQPTCIAEVGTFIGRSAVALSLGAQAGGATNIECHTCDVSNHFKIPEFDGIRMIQYMSQTSTQMFQSLVSSGARPNLFHIDGRLGNDDLALIAMLNPGSAFFLLDDFEGLEKGVANAFLLQSLIGKSHTLLYPPTRNLLGRGILEDFRGDASCAVFAPTSSFLVSAQ
jgi:hypothetical protein